MKIVSTPSVTGQRTPRGWVVAPPWSKGTGDRVHVKLVVRAVLLATVLLGGATHATADPDRTALVVSGTATPHARALATATIEAAVRDAGASLARQTFTSSEEASLKACVTAAQAWRCIAPAIRDKGLDQVALVSLVMGTSFDGSPMITLIEQIIVAKLDAAIEAQRVCTRCTDDLLVEVVAELTRVVLQEISVRSDRSIVTLHSTPRGARITFDGSPAGATDRSFPTFLGTHTVVLELEGYQRETRAIDAVLDRTIELTVAMRPTARLAPRLTVGLGGLAMIAGAVVLVFDEGPVTQPIGTEQPARYRDTIAPGLGLVLSGAALGAGGLLWWEFTRSTMAPTVAPMAGGAVIGVTNAF